MANYVQKAIDGLKQVRDELAHQLERIDMALAALDEGVQKTRSTRSRKPCCNKDEVISILRELLRDNGSLSKSELEELAKDKLSNQFGKSLSGFAMRFKEALSNAEFTEVTPGVYQLAPVSRE